MSCVDTRVFRDKFGNAVCEGENYAVGRGARVALANQMTVFQYEDGSWYGKPRHGGCDVRLGVPGQQDDAGGQAALTFVPLDSNWEELVGDAVVQSVCESSVTAVVDRIDKRRQLRESEIDRDIEIMLAMFPEATIEQKDILSSFVCNGDGRTVIDRIIASRAQLAA